MGPAPRPKPLHHPRDTSTAEPLLRRWSRRAITIPGVTLAWLIAVGLGVPALAIALLLDVARPRRRLARCRAVLAIAWILSLEVAGLLAALVVWLRFLGRRDRAAFAAANYRLQQRWTDAMFGGAVRIFGLRIEARGLDVELSAPFVLMVRHVSSVDTVLAAALLANRRGLRLRYVLKRELLLDPNLDVVGQRLPNVFVDRGQRNDAHVAAIASLADTLGPGEGVLIYPEGTRFSPARLARAVERLADRPELAARARRMRHVLPPRSRGPLALVERGLDVVVIGHTGLEGARTIADFWSGGLVGATIRVSVRRFPEAEVPAGADARVRWLYDRWLELDEWIEAG